MHPQQHRGRWCIGEQEPRKSELAWSGPVKAQVTTEGGQTFSQTRTPPDRGHRGSKVSLFQFLEEEGKKGAGGKEVIIEKQKVRVFASARRKGVHGLHEAPASGPAKEDRTPEQGVALRKLPKNCLRSGGIQGGNEDRDRGQRTGSSRISPTSVFIPAATEKSTVAGS